MFVIPGEDPGSSVDRRLLQRTAVRSVRLEDAWHEHGKPKVLSSDQGSQFTSKRTSSTCLHATAIISGMIAILVLHQRPEADVKGH